MRGAITAEPGGAQQKGKERDWWCGALGERFHNPKWNFEMQAGLTLSGCHLVPAIS